MKMLQDCFGRKVRFTDERRAHILEHPEMQNLAAEVEWVLRQPQFVRRSRADEAVKLFYEFYAQTLWVANGSALWLSMRRTMRLWLRPT